MSGDPGGEIVLDADEGDLVAELQRPVADLAGAPAHRRVDA
ncbi:MAG TPA: hypothetical protein VD903_17835 [Pseudonocardia sp.]|nr:hypothetical protein [Pseudonocardia sp.]